MAAQPSGERAPGRTDRPAMLILVDNNLAGDSRVLKQVSAARRAGFDVLVRAITAEQSTQTLDADGAMITLAAYQRPPYEMPDAPKSGGRASRLRRFWPARRRGARQPTHGESPSSPSTPSPRPGASESTSGLQRSEVAAPEQWDALDPVGAAIRRAWTDLGDPDVDVIHANDTRTLPYAMALAERLRADGRATAVVYDAHEWVIGYDDIGPERHAASMGIEANLIGRVDKVLTVSDVIAEKLRSTYGLPTTPTVVRNTPESPGAAVTGPGLRDRLRVDEHTPVVVYSGSTGSGRDLRLCVEALTHAPDVVLGVIVRTSDQPRVRDVAEHAARLGVRDRVRFTRFVPQDQIVQFLAEADAGVIPFTRTANNDIAIPTKAGEYAVAGIPVISSSVPALSEFVRENGIGEVYQAGDAADLGAAMSRAVADRARYRPGLEAVAASYVWDADAAVLTEAWTEAALHAGASAPDLAAAESSPAEGTRAEARATDRAPDSTRASGLLIGPLTSTADARALAGIESQVSLLDSESLDDEADPFSVIRAWAARVSHLLLAGFVSPVRRSFATPDVVRQVSAAEEAGITVGLLLTGREVLPPVTEVAPTGAEAQTRDRQLLRRQMRIEFLGLPTYSSSALVCERFDWVRWLPLPVDPTWFTQDHSADQAVTEEGSLTVVDLRPQTERGNDAETTRRLADVAARAGGTVVVADDLPLVDVPRAIRSAGVVVDTLRGQRCSLRAIQAMAAGKSVVGSGTRDDPESRVLLRATPAEAPDVVAELLADPKQRTELGARARDFALIHHDGRQTRAVLAEFTGGLA